MISGSFYGKTSNGAIKPKISWSAEENIEGNYSDVTATLSYSRTDSYTTYGHWAGSLSIDGDEKTVSGKYVQITRDSNTVTITHTVQVPHNEDGTKTVTISATGSIADTTLTKTTISDSVALTDIPRAASIHATDAQIGGVSMVTIGRRSEQHTHTVSYRFGALEGYLSEDGPSEEAVQLSAASLAFPVPEAFYYEIPDKTRDWCTLTCTTFLGTEQIGTPQQTTFSVWAAGDLCRPQPQIHAEDVNEKTLALTGDPGAFVRYGSTVQCTFQGNPRYGAVITEQTLNGEPVEGDGALLEQVQASRLALAVKDSRGYSAQAYYDLDPVLYFPPTLRLTAARTDATSGNAELKAEGSFFNGSFGAQDNSLRIQYRVGSGEAVSAAPEVEGNAFRLQLALTGLDYTQSHLISLTVADSLNTVTAQARIHPGIPVFEWGKEDFRFHVPVFVQDKELLPLLEQSVADCVRRTGDTMEGELSLGGNRLTQLGAPQEDTDGANKAYVDGKLTIVKLWENADTGSSFAAQTVPVDLTGFDGVCIYYKNQSTGTLFLNTGLIPLEQKGVLWYVFQSGNHCYRTFVAAREGVAFEAGHYTGSTSGNSICLPAMIYGIKGVSG